MKECYMGVDPEQDHDQERFYVMALVELTIYGHTIDTWTQKHYPEDWRQTLWSRKHGREFGCWHSQVCREGELGYNPTEALIPITFKQFQQGAEKNWPYLRDAPVLVYADGSPVPITSIGEWNDDGSVTWVWDSLRGDIPPGKEQPQ